MKITKPERLRKGDVIGICAPASPPASVEDLNKGIGYLEKLGYRVELGKNVYRRNGYLAGSDIQRASDINSFFAERKIRAIFTARGGYGSQRILPLLDYRTIKNNPKILVGYSDITALHFALLAKCGLVSFSGPMVSAEMSGGLTGEAEDRFWRNLTSVKACEPLCGKKNRIRRSGQHISSSGRMIGGNLSIISSLAGTEYFPDLEKPVLILEEIDERPYRVDRMLGHLKQTRLFGKIRGVAFGDFSSCRPEKGKPSRSVNRVILDDFGGYGIPVVSGIKFGHIKNSASFPIGVRVRLDGGKNRVVFLEGGVSS